MMRSAVDMQRLRDVCERYGVASLEVFGSAAHDGLTDDSDIDLLYTLAPGARLGWAIEDLSDELSQVLGREVDLVSRDALHPRLRDRVLNEAQSPYESDRSRLLVHRSGSPPLHRHR